MHERTLADIDAARHAARRESRRRSSEHGVKRARVCSHVGCPALSYEPRCPEHARPNSTQRGYDADHKRESRTWIARVAAGEHVVCWRCQEPITDPSDCHLGHDDDDRTVTRGPEHGRACNLSAAGKKSRA